MQRERRKWTSEQKLQGILPVIRGAASLSEQARRLKVAGNRLYRWWDQANTAVLEACNTSGSSSRERELEEKVGKLERLCGKQAAQIELLKNTLAVDKRAVVALWVEFGQVLSQCEFCPTLEMSRTSLWRYVSRGVKRAVHKSAVGIEWPVPVQPGTGHTLCWRRR